MTDNTVEVLYNSMPDNTIKRWNIQSSPDNPFTGLICYCKIYKINPQWGSIFAYNQYGTRKIKTMSDGILSDWK